MNDIDRYSDNSLRPDQLAPHATDGVGPVPVPGRYALTPPVQAMAAKLEG